MEQISDATMSGSALRTRVTALRITSVLHRCQLAPGNTEAIALPEALVRV